MTPLVHQMIAMGLFAVAVILKPMAAEQQCDPLQQNWTVASTASAMDLSEATNCSGGVFFVTWVNHVVLESEISVLEGTQLSIAGSDSNAIADGGGSTPFFNVSNAVLRIENMTFLDAYRGGSGGAFLVSNSELTFTGRTVFARNRCSRNGGAMSISNSNVTWTGDTKFVQNKATDYWGLAGALYVSESELTFSGATYFDSNEAFGEGGAMWTDRSMVNSTGEMEFFNNTAIFYDGGAVRFSITTFYTMGTLSFVENYTGEDGGAIRLYQSEIYSSGHTSFVDNNATRRGGAIFGTDDSLQLSLGTAIFSGNSASAGGAISLAGSSFVPTTFTWLGNTTFSNNSAIADGGGLSVGQGCDISWNGTTTFVDNTAGNDGGGVAIDGDSGLSSAGSTYFVGNSAVGSGGAVYSIGNIEGFSYVGSTFENNSAAIGGAIASYSTGQGSSNTYTNCLFQHNSATFIGGAMEASTGNENIQNSSFIENSAGTGGALSLSGTVEMENVFFRDNAASEDLGPAIRNIGRITSMINVSFNGNYFVCGEEQFLDFVEHDDGNQRYEAVCNGCLVWADCDACEIDNGAMEPECFQAPDHTSADPGTSLQTLVIDNGFYRATNTSTQIFKCYNEEACLGGQSGSAGFCAIGYMGPYCSICEEGYAGTQAFTCATCSGERRTVVLSIAIVAIVVGGVVVYAIVAHMVAPDSGEDGIDQVRDSMLRRLPLPALTAVKIVITVWQILTQFSEVANVTYPEAYEELLGILDIINVDLGSLISAGCLWDGIDFHDRVLFSTLAPLGILVLLGITYTFALRAAESESEDCKRRVKEKHVSALLLLTFLVYSSVSSIVFQTFACERLEDGNDYLRADYRILCTEPKHHILQVYAVVMVAVYPVGIPLFYLFLVCPVRSTLGDGEARSRNQHAERIKDLWKPYRPACFYYEVVECLRRIMSTGVIVFIYPGDAAQIAVTLSFTFMFFLISEVLSPYESSWNTWLSRMGHVIVLCSFFIALLYKVDVSSEREASQEIFGVVLVVVHVCLAIFILFSGVVHWLSHDPVEASPDIPVRRTGRHNFSLGGPRDVAGVELFDGIMMTAVSSGAIVTEEGLS